MFYKSAHHSLQTLQWPLEITAFLKCGITLLCLFIRQALHDEILFLKRQENPYLLQYIPFCNMYALEHLSVSHFKQLGNSLSKETFQTSCIICNWCLPFHLIASASQITCFNAHFAYVLVQVVAWILLSNVLHGPWLIWIVKGMTKTVWSIRWKSHQMDSGVVRCTFVFYLKFHLFSASLQEF